MPTLMSTLEFELCNLRYSFSLREGYVQMTILVTMIVRLRATCTLTKTPAILVVVLTCTFMMSFAWSSSPLGWLIPSRNQNSKICICSELQHPTYLHNSSSILVHAMSHASLHIHILLGLDCVDGSVRRLLIA